MYQSEVKNLTLGDNEIEWATGLRYLGVLFTSAKMLTVDMSVQTRKFYAASRANSILHNTGSPPECVYRKPDGDPARHRAL